MALHVFNIRPDSLNTGIITLYLLIIASFFEYWLESSVCKQYSMTGKNKREVSSNMTNFYLLIFLVILGLENIKTSLIYYAYSFLLI